MLMFVKLGQSKLNVNEKEKKMTPSYIREKILYQDNSRTRTAKTKEG